MRSGDRGNANIPDSTGDLALVPHGRGHVIASAPGLARGKAVRLPRAQVSERYEILRLGGEGERTTMICGHSLNSFSNTRCMVLSQRTIASAEKNTASAE